MSVVLASALDYAARGWPVVPITPGGKSPRIDDWPVRATVDPALIDKWWKMWPEAGVGIVTGTRSGLLVLDVDVSHTKRGDESLADLEATFGKLPDTVEVITGSGGRHLYFRLPVDDEGQTISVDSSAGTLGMSLDVRCDGGQVLAPPTVHPSGGVYEWEASSHPDDVEMAVAPDWLIEQLTSPPGEMVAERKPRQRDGGEVTPGDKFDATADPAKVIIDMAGGVYLGKRKHRETGLEYHLIGRPPMPEEQGYKPHISATWDYLGAGVLKVFTDSWRGADPNTGEVWKLTQNDTYSLFGLLTMTRFGGSFSAAASALAHKEISDMVEEWLEEDPEPPAPAEIVSESGWAEPIDFDDNLRLDPWPVDVWPSWVSDEVAACAEAQQVSMDMPSVLVWFAMGTLCAGKVDVAGSPTFIQPTNVMTCGVAPSGGSKSPVAKRMMSPLYDLEADMQRTAADAIRRSDATKRKLEADVKRAERALDKGEHGADQLWYDATSALDAHADVVPPLLLASDVTPERLETLLAEHGSRMGLVSTEGAEVLSSMTGARYKSGGELGQIPPVFLKGFDGDPIRTDRMGREKVLINRPLLSVGIYLQPSVIEELAKHPQIIKQGGLGRLLWCWQPDNVGDRDMGRWVDATPPLAPYRDHLTELGRKFQRRLNPSRIAFTPDAQRLAVEWFESLERRHRFGADLAVDAVKESAQKMRGYLLRCAGILAVAHGEDEVSAQRVADAVRFLDVCVAHLSYTLQQAGSADTPAALVRLVASWVSSHAGETVEVRDLQMAFRSRFDTVLDTRPVLHELLERRWIRLLGGSLADIGNRGKPNPKIEVNPLVGERRAGRAGRASDPASESSGDAPRDPASRGSRVVLKTFPETSSSLSDSPQPDSPCTTRDPRDVHNAPTDDTWEVFR